MLIDRMYCVEWDQGTGSWRLVWDDTDRRTPAAYYTVDEADKRRSEMAKAFPQYKYRVVGYEHRAARSTTVRGTIHD